MSQRQLDTASAYLDPQDGLSQGSSSPKKPDYAFLPNAVIPLTFPLEKEEGVTVREITIRRPKVKDNMAVNAIAAGKSEEETGIILMRHLTGLTPAEFEELDLADVKRLGEWLQVFTSARRKN